MIAIAITANNMAHNTLNRKAWMPFLSLILLFPSGSGKNAF
jgi:hypothetical protein